MFLADVVDSQLVIAGILDCVVLDSQLVTSWYTRLCRPVFLADVVDSQLVTAGILGCVVLSF